MAVRPPARLKVIFAAAKVAGPDGLKNLVAQSKAVSDGVKGWKWQQLPRTGVQQLAEVAAKTGYATTAAFLRAHHEAELWQGASAQPNADAFLSHVRKAGLHLVNGRTDLSVHVGVEAAVLKDGSWVTGRFVPVRGSPTFSIVPASGPVLKFNANYAGIAPEKFDPNQVTLALKPAFRLRDFFG